MADNLALWHAVEKTDPKHVKPITGKSYTGTSPKPHWLVMRATETFGPVGIGWGYTIEERIENGAMIEPGHFERLHIAKVRVWFKWNGERGEVEHIGGTPLSGKRKNGALYTDEDAPKKSVTDALVKALSMIGFAGDIFMGRHDDSNYVSDIRHEFEEARSGPSAADRYLEDCITAVAHFDDAAELGNWWKNNTQTRKDMLTADQSNRLKEIVAGKGEALKQKVAA